MGINTFNTMEDRNEVCENLNILVHLLHCAVGDKR